jgi:hypothetical protein
MWIIVIPSVILLAVFGTGFTFGYLWGKYKKYDKGDTLL